MKVGDLVREKIGRSAAGVVVEKQGSSVLGMYWRVLFGNELIYVREADLEVISESR